MVALGEVVEVRGGGTPSKANSAFWRGDIPWVSPKDMKTWEIHDAEDKITSEAIERSATNLIPKDAILIVNRSGILKHTLPVGITRRPLAINQDVKALICGPRSHPEYIAHLVKAAEPVILKWVRATTADNFPIENLRSLEIPLPLIDQQRRIAAILDKADAMRRKRRRALDLLDSLTQSIFQEMFGDPVSNPKHFPVKPFGEIGRLDRGVSKHRPRNDPILLGGPYPFVQTGDVANSGGYIRSYSSTYSEAGLKQSKLWPAGTLCITIAANIAGTGILTFPACFPDSVVGFTHEQPAMAQFIRVWLSFLRSTLERLAPTVAQKNINLQILRALEVALPPHEMLNSFAAKLGVQLKMQEQLRDVAAESEVLFSSLQQRAFSGELV
jgi:type I restriction enzyme S subunit